MARWILVGAGQHRLIKGDPKYMEMGYQGSVVAVHGVVHMFASNDQYLGQRSTIFSAKQYMEELLSKYGDTGPK
jgi:hypothetical protein